MACYHEDDSDTEISVEGSVKRVNGVKEELTQEQRDALSGPIRAEVKHLDRKHTERGQCYYSETVDDIPPEQIDWWQKYVLCLTRYMSKDGKRVERTSLQVNSQHIKDLLKTAIDRYPGETLDTKDVTIDLPCCVLYHYLDELKQESDKLDSDSEAASHVRVLFDFIQTQHGETIKQTSNLLPQGVVTFDLLWTIFKPGTIIFSRVFDQSRAFKLVNSCYGVCNNRPFFAVTLSYVDFDGKDFGNDTTSMRIFSFAGTTPIKRLSFVPRAFEPAAENLERQLVARGKRLEEYAGMHFASYSGIALEREENDEGDTIINRVHVDGRVAIDCATYNRFNGNYAFSVTTFEGKSKDRDEYTASEDANSDAKLLPDRKLKFEPLDDEQLLIANAVVRGFSFNEKKWVDMFLDTLTSANWNNSCFDQLVLASSQKTLIKALVTEHITDASTFDDIVRGKGKGLVLVLHGPPGVGKTLTAECVAEHCERPLYIVSSGDLGTDSHSLDSRLTKILDMASTWKTPLLIDEADVFLERRGLHDMERNALVSIFLRVLEYYQGILFLTSNRVSTFDDAFKSRIHVPLKYSNLDTVSRTQIWKNFLHKIEDLEIDEDGYKMLAKEQLNGREIKNVVRTSGSLARFHGKPLDLGLLRQVIEIQKDFERDLEELDGE